MDKLTLLSINTNYRSDYIDHFGRNNNTIEIMMELAINDTSSSFNIVDIIPSIMTLAENHNNTNRLTVIPELIKQKLKVDFTLEEIEKALNDQYPEKFY